MYIYIYVYIHIYICIYTIFKYIHSYVYIYTYLDLKIVNAAAPVLIPRLRRAKKGKSSAALDTYPPDRMLSMDKSI